MYRPFTALCVICSFVFLVSVPVTIEAQEKEEIEQELKSLHKKLDKIQSKLQQTQQKKQKTKGKLREVEQKETSLLSLVERYSNNIESGSKNLQRWKQLEKKVQKELRDINRRLKETREKLSRRRELLKRRLRAIYKQGELRQAQILMDSKSMTDFLTRARYFQHIVNQDQSMIENFKETRRELKQLKSKRQDVLARRRRIRKREQSWLNHLKDLKEQQRQLLAEIRNRKDFFRRRIEELQEQQSKLQGLVVELQEERKEKASLLEQLSTEFGRKRGSLPWPVESRDICRPFGQWEERGLVHNNDGIDICLNEGARVKAVAAGKVLVAKPFRGMGKIVIIGHGGKYTTLYGSLVKTHVKTGQQVESGDVIGQAGQTSGMDEPRLYFQLFEDREILNPKKWLR